MEIGDIVKVNVPYVHGRRKEKEDIRVAKIIGIYPHFVLVKFKEGYRACYRREEIIK